MRVRAVTARDGRSDGTPKDDTQMLALCTTPGQLDRFTLSLRDVSLRDFSRMDLDSTILQARIMT